LSSESLDRLHFIGLAFYHSTSLPSKASDSVSFLFGLFQECLAIINNLIMDIGLGHANRFVLGFTIIAIGIQYPCHPTWVQMILALLDLSIKVFQLSDIVAYL
jgi:hypothetical protein